MSGKNVTCDQNSSASKENEHHKHDMEIESSGKPTGK